MIFLNELKYNKIYTKKCMLPINEKDKIKGSLIMLLSPNIQSSINQINDRIFINKYFYSYYIERDMNIFINGDEVLDESSLKLPRYESILDRSYIDYLVYDKCINVMNNDMVSEAVNDYIENETVYESGNENYNTIIKRLMYNERMRTPKELIAIYDDIKKNCPDIRYTYLYLERYKNRNLFTDFYYYNKSFFENNNLEKEKGLKTYLELLSRFIFDKRYNEYKQKYVMIPVNHWKQIIGEGKQLHMYTDSINPISIIYRLIKKDYDKLVEVFGDTTFIFTGNMRYMKVNFKELDRSMADRFLKNINKIGSNDPIQNDDEENNPNIESKKFIKMNIIDKLEKSLKLRINNLTGDGETTTEKEIIERIDKAALSSNTTDDAMSKLNNDPDFKQLLLQISSEGSGGSNISDTRRKRLNTVTDEFMKKKINDMSVEEILNNKNEEIEVTKLDIDSVNDEWEEMSYMNFEKSFNQEQEILNTLISYNEKSLPLAVLDLQIEDKSTSEDLVDLYTIKLEDSNGKRFTVKLDVPKTKDDKFLLLKGNVKKVSGQLMLKPITKSDRDTVQIVSNYKKIFIRRFGQKSDVISDTIVKTLKKNPSGVTYTYGDNRVVNKSYVIPYDYEYLAGLYDKIETKDHIILFNQEEIRHKYTVDESKGLPFAYHKPSKSIIYSPKDVTVSSIISSILIADSKSFADIYENASIGKKYMYSRASILDTNIPLIIVCAYNEGLTQIMDKANIKYEFTEKKPKYNVYTQDVIRFSDGYILYELTPESSLLMNGLKDCGTERFSLGDINSREMYLTILDRFGSRVILSDGLENFYDLMIDPKTKEILEILNLPTKYTEVLIYANGLLADSSYTKHTDLDAYRYRSSEIVTACVYSALANAYVDYKRQLKNGKKDASLSVKQNAVVNELLLLPTTSDFSIINPLYELEAINEVSYKGKSGMNSDRAYDLAKRSYDKSMINNIGMSTNFAGNVGINRQMTVNAHIINKHGFMKTKHDPDEMGINTFTATELMTPMGALHSDPMRTAMTFIQKAKHQMSTRVAHPNLITTGMDDAMPYMITNTFVYKTKDAGKVIEIVENKYMIIEYKNGSKDMINLDTTVVKNSDGGFYSELQLVPKVKEGQTFKKDEIIAYEPKWFSTDAGYNNNLTCNSGILIKMAKIYTDESYEDSTIISEWLSEAGSSDISLKKRHVFDKNTNILSMVSKGDPIQEGDSLIVFQEGFEDEDVQKLLAKLSDDNTGMVDELGRRKIKSKVTGWVNDIKIYRTVDIEELSPSLQKIVNKYEADIRKLKNVCKKHGIDKQLDPDYKLEPTGKLKDVYDGVLIEIQLKYKDDLSVGDKIVFYDALKGVARFKFPEGKEPYTAYRPDEKIHAFLGLSSCQGRMVTSVDIVAALNKGIIELDRQCKDILNIPIKYIDQM